MQDLLDHCQGFVYAVARSGVTGKHTEFQQSLPELIKKIRQLTDLPIAVGFGIQTPEDIELLKPHADYAIVGSQALQILKQKGLPGLREFWQQLQSAT